VREERTKEAAHGKRCDQMRSKSGEGFQQYQAIIKDDYRHASLEILNPGKEGIRQAYIVGECQPPVDDGFESS